MSKDIALGFGNNTDYELIWSSSVVEKAIKEFKIFQKDIENKAIVNTERDLLISMLYFLQNNIGGECSVINTSILDKFANRFKYKITIGGTGIRAAIAMNVLDYYSFLHLVVLNEKIKDLIPSSCDYICSNKEENYDIHLIFQYPKNCDIKENDIKIKTKRENRIIIGNNDINSVMNLDPIFFDKYVNKSKVLLISGFNTMIDISLLNKRLDLISSKLEKLKNKGIKIYYEDACFIKEECNQLCKDKLFKYVDVFSFNEDEFITYCDRQIDLMDVSSVILGLEELYKRFNVKTLVVHSRYWAIAYGEDCIKYKECLKGGITMATTRFRFGDNFNSKNQYIDTYNLRDGIDELNFAHQFNEKVKEKGICVPSVQVKEHDVTTVGLGDAFVGGFLPALSEVI